MDAVGAQLHFSHQDRFGEESELADLPPVAEERCVYVHSFPVKKEATLNCRQTLADVRMQSKLFAKQWQLDAGTAPTNTFRVMGCARGHVGGGLAHMDACRDNIRFHDIQQPGDSPGVVQIADSVRNGLTELQHRVDELKASCSDLEALSAACQKFSPLLEAAVTSEHERLMDELRARTLPSYANDHNFEDSSSSLTSVGDVAMLQRCVAALVNGDDLQMPVEYLFEKGDPPSVSTTTLAGTLDATSMAMDNTMGSQQHFGLTPPDLWPPPHGLPSLQLEPQPILSLSSVANAGTLDRTIMAMDNMPGRQQQFFQGADCGLTLPELQPSPCCFPFLQLEPQPILFPFWGPPVQTLNVVQQLPLQAEDINIMMQ